MHPPRLPLNLSSQAFIENKTSVYRWMLEERPVCPISFSMIRGHFVCRYEDCELILKDRRFRRQVSEGSGGEWWRGLLPRSWALSLDTLLNKDAPDHKRLRGFINAAFTPRAVQALAPDIEARTDALLDAMEARGDGPVDLIEGLALPLPAMVIGALLGVGEVHMERFVSLIRAVVESFRGWGMVRNLTWDIPRVVRFLDDFLAHKRASPADDLLSALIRIEMDGDRLTNDELVGLTLALIIGGFETTTHLISGAVVTLCEHPESREALRADASLLPGALEEVMRFTSPVFTTDRAYPREPVTLHGVTLEPGQMVLACVGAANRDPRAFEQPDVFDIHRRPNRHLGFGMGAHYCVGAPLARLEARVALERLFARFDGLRLAVPVETLRHVPTVSLNAYAAVPLHLR